METIILAEVVEKGMGALLTFLIADRREFIKISQAVGVGFLVMGAVGYIVKLSKLLFRSCAFVGLFPVENCAPSFTPFAPGIPERLVC